MKLLVGIITSIYFLFGTLVYFYVTPTNLALAMTYLLLFIVSVSLTYWGYKK